MLYNAQLYDDAVKEFQAAYVAFPNPLFLYNIGQAFRNAGKLEPAAAAYERYLAESPRAADREDVQTLIEQLRGDLAAQKRRLESPAQPPPPPPREAKGVLPPPPLGPGSPASHSPLRTVGAGLAGIGVAVAIAGGGLMVWAQTTSGDYRDAYGRCFPGARTTSCTDRSLGDLARRGDALNVAGPLVLAAGVATAALGTYLFARHRRREAPRVTAAPLLSPGGFGLAVAGSFP